MEKMTDLQVKGNAAIAVWLKIPSTPGRFGGLYYGGHDLEKAGLPFSTGWMGTGTDTLKFHSSWDWLMVPIGIMSNRCEEPEILDDLRMALLCNDINTAFNEVVDLIEQF